MSYELHGSAVITGTLNCYCLACECFLENEDEALRHIKTSSHCHTLISTPYLDKFNNHYIRKFKSGYFCGFCNKLMKTLLHVDLHLSEQCHLQNRGAYLLKSRSPNVIAFSTLMIKENAWQGLIGNTCCICETEFEDEIIHKKETGHMLSVIQNAVKFGENDEIYRLLNDLSFHCITCNKLLPLKTMSKHFKDNEHFDQYSKCKVDNSFENFSSEHIADANQRDNGDGVKVHNIKSDTKNCGHNQDNNDTEKEEYVTKTSTIDTTHIKNSETEKISMIENIETSNEADQLDCNEFSENSNLYADGNDGNINESIEKKRDTKTDCTNQKINNDSHEQPVSLDLETIAIDNNITYTESHAFCKTCQVSLPFKLKFIEEHIKGVRHTKKIMATLRKERMEDFLHSILHVQLSSQIEINSGYLINDKYYITLLSMKLLTVDKSGVSLTCLLCGNTLPEYPKVPVAHINGCSLPKGRHLQIIASIEDEFIREIRPATFHCGFCHTVVPGWYEMQRHLRSPEHNLQKSQSYERFRYIKLRLFTRFIKIIDLTDEQ